MRRGKGGLGNAALRAAGTPEQQQKWGQLTLAMAITEPGCGSDPSQVQTTAVLDPATLGSRGTLTAGREPVRIAFTPDGNRALVANAGESTVTVFDARGLVRLSSIPVIVSPSDIAVSDDGKHAWVASDRDHQLSVIDIAQGIEVGRIPVGEPAVSLRWVAPP